ncbi:MAG: hypothetical protein QOH21_1031 [Acidobacteriota bacterium]|nr:hypothetical protein [Acidobacteriota bacterium]
MRFVLILILSLSCAVAPADIPLAKKQRGMSYACAFRRDVDVRYGSPASAESLQKLQSLGVNWISITPFGFRRAGSPKIHFGGDRMWETDDSLRGATRQAHALGIKVMLKPHLWVRGEETIGPWKPADFAHYERFIVYYAKLATEMKVDALCLGNELKRSTHDEQAWRRLIAKVRAVYRGPLTYGANFDEVEHVGFWDALDWIGVSAYYPLVDAPTPTRAQLVRAWKPIVRRLATLSHTWKRPIVFTEIGYRSADRAAWRQWELPRDAPVNLAAQTAAYEAFFEAVWPQPWLAGAYPWKWFSYPNHSSAADNEWEIENKPAAEVVRKGYLAAAGRADSAPARQVR